MKRYGMMILSQEMVLLFGTTTVGAFHMSIDMTDSDMKKGEGVGACHKREGVVSTVLRPAHTFPHEYHTIGYADFATEYEATTTSSS